MAWVVVSITRRSQISQEMMGSVEDGYKKASDARSQVDIQQSIIS